jgi:hypothetical protein
MINTLDVIIKAHLFPSQGIMHTPLGGLTPPSFCMTPPSFGELGVCLGVFLGGSAGIRGVFREVVSTSTKFGLRT